MARSAGRDRVLEAPSLGGPGYSAPRSASAVFSSDLLASAAGPPVAGYALLAADTGSRMPNCLRTAMNRPPRPWRQPMPWMPMAAPAARGRGRAFALTLPPEARAGAARPALGRPRLTCPAGGVAGVGWVVEPA